MKNVQEINKRGAQDSSWYNKNEKEVIEMVKKNPELLSDLVSEDPDAYLNALKKFNGGKEAEDSIKKLIEERKALNEAMEKAKGEFILSPDVVNHYIATANDPAFYFNTDDIRIAAHLFNKKVQIFASGEGRVIGPTSKVMNPNAPGDLIVIHHQGAHFSRCIKSGDFPVERGEAESSSSDKHYVKISNDEISMLLDNEKGASQLFDKVEGGAQLSQTQLEKLGSYLKTQNATKENISSVAAILGEAAKRQRLPLKVVGGLRSCLSPDRKLDRAAIDSVEMALNSVAQQR